MRFSEEVRRRTAYTLALTGWWGALAATVLRLAGVAPASMGVMIVFLIGIAISGGLALSRQRLTSAIKGVFETGLKIRNDEYQNLRYELIHLRSETEHLRKQIKDQEGPK